MTEMSPTQRTQSFLRERGFLVAHCERKMPASARGWRGPLITQDLFGFIDTMAVSDHHLLAVQSCADTGHAERVRKILNAPAARLLALYMDIEVWSWGKRLPGTRNKKTGLLIRRKVWTLRRERFALNNGAIVSHEVDDDEISAIQREKKSGDG